MQFQWVKRGMLVVISTIKLSIVVLALSAVACSEVNPQLPKATSSGSDIQGDSTSATNSTPVFNTSPLDFTMVSMGDSITLGFDAVDPLENPGLSWVSGQELTGSDGSHFNRLQDLAALYQRPLTLHSYTVAVTGAEAISDLQGQATQAATHNPDYVTVLIGANDICNTTMDAATFEPEFEIKVYQALLTLTQSAKPPQLIFVSSIPNVAHLMEVPAMADSMACQAAWQVACPNMVDLTTTQFHDLWSAANTALNNASINAGDSVVFDDFAVADSSFEDADVTFDCFHPTVQGQRKLADTTWRAVQSRLEQRMRE